ncbi:MAG: glycoside hydrolase family 3 N-terminal domain-containing protein [Cyanobacteriota bacterium]|nr:glycoside hydrolase family 3 N-terminal domain-containing protein [Cyanobacteriota bacterium]
MGPADDLRRLCAELVVVRASGHLGDDEREYPQWELANAGLQRLLAAGVGGVILLGGRASELRLRTRQLRRWAGRPLLLCADVEEGVGQRFAGASWLVPPLALGRLHAGEPQRALALAERYGRCTGREARACGLNWVLGPVCDVNNNPANPVINVRAWGEAPAVSGTLAAAFIRGLRAERVLSCAKHFPGHGDTSVDSHLELPLLPHDRARLEAIELPPFRAAIAAGVSAVMTAHLVLPALDPERPATLSQAVLSGLLRQELGFGGLVVTDALVMEAISGHYGAGEAAVLAVEAGADLVLMPADAEAAIAALAVAVAAGRLSREQLEASARRRRAALAEVEASGNDPEGAGQGLLELLEPLAPDSALARELVAATLVRRPGGQALQARASASGPGLNLLRLDDALAAPFLPARSPALQLPQAAGFRALVVDGRSPSPWSGRPEAPLALERLGDGTLLLQLFVRGNPFRGSAAGREPWGAVLRQLQGAGRLAGLVVYGSPYLWEQLEPLLEPGVAAVYSPGQMPLAQELALGALGLGHTDGHGDFTD